MLDQLLQNEITIFINLYKIINLFWKWSSLPRSKLVDKHLLMLCVSKFTKVQLFKCSETVNRQAPAHFKPAPGLARILLGGILARIV
jgi:hypothetical protein